MDNLTSTANRSTKSSKVRTEPSVLKIYLGSKRETNIEKAMKELKEYKAMNTVSKQIENDLLPGMNSQGHEIFEEVKAKYGVEITFEMNRYINRVKISGFNDQVDKSYERVVSAIHRYDKELVNSKYVEWKYIVRGGGEKSFPLNFNYVLEKSYQNIKSNPQAADANSTSQLLEVPFPNLEASGTATVNFEKNFIKLAGTQQTGIVRRRVRTGADGDDQPRDIQLPDHWKKMKDDCEMEKVEVPPGSKEFTEVLKKFTDTGLSSNMYTLYRVQNPSLYKQFAVQKAKVAKRLSQKWLRNVVTSRELFHGTSQTSSDCILKHGFDRSHAGVNGTKYGSGVYFATTAHYSTTYARKASWNSDRFMFLVEVVTGEFCRGDSSMKAVPTKPGSIEIFDSVVDNMNNPGIFVAFKDASAYPLYLLSFK